MTPGHIKARLGGIRTIDPLRERSGERRASALNNVTLLQGRSSDV
jgi:hypothetical protein